MRDQLHKALKPIKDKAGLWWLCFWKWPELLRECYQELNQLTDDLSMLRGQFRAEQARCEVFEKLSNESREVASAAVSRASAEKTLSQNLSEELGNAKVQLQKSSETVGSLENRVARMEMETERVKAELAKTQADLARSGLELEREKRGQQDARRDLMLLREFVHRTHRLDIPTRRGVKALLANGKRLTAFIALLLPMVLLSAPFPPPFFRSVYTTNTAAWANTNVISLSTTNATSKPLTNHYQDGVLTLFGLEAGANITLSHNPSNIVITGAAGGGDAGGTNARQFGTLTLTNLSGNPIPYTNIILADVGIAIGTNSGITYITNTINTNAFQPAAANLTNWANIPTGAMANVVSTTFLTNWANAISNYVTASTNSASVTNWINFRQPADAVLSNFVGTVANNVTNIVSLSTTNATSKPLTNSYTAGVLTLFGLEQGANITLTPNGSNIVVASTASGGGITTNANQFLGVPLSIIDGALMTNMNFWSPSGGTNRGDFYTDAILPLTSNSVSIGSAGLPWMDITLKGELRLTEKTDGFNYVGLNGPNAMVGNYSLAFPDVQGADGQVLTNNGGGLLGWWTPVSSGGGISTNSNQFAANTTLTIKYGALLTNTVFYPSNVTGPAFIANAVTGQGTNVSEWRNTNEGVAISVNSNLFLIASNVTVNSNIVVQGTNISTWVQLAGGQGGSKIIRTDSNTNLVAATIGAGLSFDGTTLNTASGTPSSIATNANQFGAQVTLTIKEGALLTNTLFYQSNIAGPATIALSSIGGITNLSEWRQSNGTPLVTVNSNAQLSFGREDIKTAILFRTNQIDLSTYQWKPFTNSLQTNIVLQITNIQAGVQTTLDIYGAGIMGGTVTNAWQVLFTVGAGNTIFWPVGATNGNFDVLVNSNQVVQVNLWASRKTNLIASYKAFE